MSKIINNQSPDINSTGWGRWDSCDWDRGLPSAVGLLEEKKKMTMEPWMETSHPLGNPRFFPDLRLSCKHQTPLRYWGKAGEYCSPVDKGVYHLKPKTLNRGWFGGCCFCLVFLSANSYQ